MLTILGRRNQTGTFCDGLSRRSFLQVGGLGSLALPHLLRAEAATGRSQPHKAVIMIFLTGGPPHQDMYDLKMDAPQDIRGPFKPIATKVPGISICEHLPEIAARMDKFVAIRSVVGSEGGHSQYQCTTGWDPSKPPVRQWPAFGSAVARLQGPANRSVPPYTSLWYKWNEPNPGAGFLGAAYSPFEPKGEDRKNMVLNGVTLDQLEDRRTLLTGLDRWKEEVGQSAGVDRFRDQAFDILTTSKLAHALDLSKEDPQVLKRYGKGDDTKRLPSVPQNFLAARRLVEAGARVVTLNHDVWDWHDNNFKSAQAKFPVFEKALTALVDDLADRGMLNDVTVLAWGEFGRTPKINSKAGRDHWPRVSCALLAGGGMNTGQVIGATDRLGGEARERPVHFQEVMATLYHNLGLNVNLATIQDLNGRPQYLVESGVQPIRELI